MAHDPGDEDEWTTRDRIREHDAALRRSHHVAGHGQQLVPRLCWTCGQVKGDTRGDECARCQARGE